MIYRVKMTGQIRLIVTNYKKMMKISLKLFPLIPKSEETRKLSETANKRRERDEEEGRGREREKERERGRRREREREKERGRKKERGRGGEGEEEVEGEGEEEGEKGREGNRDKTYD